FILINARVVDYPIVYCNDGFVQMSGFYRVEVMQKPGSVPFMCGELTNREAVKRMEHAFEVQESEQLEILLYKKNKTPLWLLLNIAPVRNEKEIIVLFVLTFKDITAWKQPIEDDVSKGFSFFIHPLL
ncbi:hypothetical protein HELRODRAFT_62998, partial [Helobdella robusta]|uniref:PAC domain-containing protein n=1 Tax=Helobdella robusta TaxID=6412 RepID=T1FX94_HELRO